jgi:uncharacterized repeat protein (TIGR01451 family)
MSVLQHPAVLRTRVIAILVLAVAAGLAGLVAGPPAAAAAGPVYAAVTASGAGSCADPADACTLSAALGQVAPGGVVQLVTPGSTGRYVGNWTVSTAGTSASAPVTIEPLPGLASQPVLDGNNGGSTGCSTSWCSGPVLTVRSGEYVAITGITIADGDNTGTFSAGGGLSVYGTVTVTGCVFTGNTAYYGGAIDDGAYLGGGQVTVSASTFTGNTGYYGGAIDSGGFGGDGSVTVTASTFTGNTAYNGGAIDSGDYGGGSVTVTASTFAGNSASNDGGAIDGGDDGGGGTVTVAADVFADSCDQAGGTWHDQGYNATSDWTCFNLGPGDVAAGDPAALDLGPLVSNGGPTQTIMPQPGSPAIGIIPGNTLVSLPGGTQWLCPVTDQRGYYTSAPGACDAGAVQTTGSAPLKLADSTTSTGFHQAGDQITYRYKVTNTNNTTLFGITITDPAVPAAACPQASLAPGAAETCTGSYTVTAADVTAGKVTDTATATATTVSGTVLSGSSTVTVYGPWPATVTGTPQPSAGAAKGYYLGVSGSTWTLEVTHPGTGKVAFTGKITINTGKITGLRPISLGTGDSARIKGKTLTFTITSHGQVNGFRFTANQAASAAFTLKVGGKAAAASQIHLGTGATKATSPSPLTFTR